MTHTDLVFKSEKWLKNQNCGVIVRDQCRASTQNGEQPDCIGWRSGVTILIECKTSRTDFLADKKKQFRQYPELGMGDWRFYICPPNVIKIKDLPEGWGLLYAHEKKIMKVFGIPTNAMWCTKKPFKGNKVSESDILYSIARRMTIHGHFEDIYNGFNKELAL